MALRRCRTTPEGWDIPKARAAAKELQQLWRNIDRLLRELSAGLPDEGRGQVYIEVGYEMQRLPEVQDEYLEAVRPVERDATRAAGGARKRPYARSRKPRGR